MIIQHPYQARRIRFIEVVSFQEWKIKMYGISMHGNRVEQENLDLAKENIPFFLLQAKSAELPTYGVATLIVHEGREGCFFIINWWIDENMLQNFVFLRRKGAEGLSFFSGNGICTCVWEMAIWWHERTAWVKHVLQKWENPDFEAYLSDTFYASL